VSTLDAADVREEVTVADVLRSAGIEPPAHGRMACPIHGGDNLSAFSVTHDGWRWSCWTRCGSGDAIDLAMRLHGLDFRGALEHCAELAGIVPTYRARTDVAAAIARRAARPRSIRTTLEAVVRILRGDP